MLKFYFPMHEICHFVSSKYASLPYLLWARWLPLPCKGETGVHKKHQCHETKTIARARRRASYTERRQSEEERFSRREGGRREGKRWGRREGERGGRKRRRRILPWGMSMCGLFWIFFHSKKGERKELRSWPIQGQSNFSQWLLCGHYSGPPREPQLTVEIVSWKKIQNKTNFSYGPINTKSKERPISKCNAENIPGNSGSFTWCGNAVA